MYWRQVVASTLPVPAGVAKGVFDSSWAAGLRRTLTEGGSLSGYERDKLFSNRGAGQPFLDVSSVSGADSPGDGRAAVAADFDNDGDTDLFVHNASLNRHHLYRNEIGGSRRWVRLILEGRVSNRDAVGALVRASVRGGPPATVRHVACGEGFESGSDRRVLIGLGGADGAEQVEIRWPSGKTQRLGTLAAGGTYRVIEGEAPVRVELAPFELGRVRSLDLAKLSVTTVEGKRLGAPELSASWLLLNLWSPACAPCLVEMPEMQALAERYAGRLRVVGMAMVPPAQQADVERMAAKLAITYPIALAPADLPETLGAGASVPLPSSYLFAPGGSVSGVYRGLSELERLKRDLARSLASP